MTSSPSSQTESLHLFRKAVTLFAVAVGVPVLLQSPWLAAVTGRAYIGPVALGFLPLPPQQHHFALLVVGFGLWLIHNERMAKAGSPSRRERIVSAVLVGLATLVAFVVTHPSAEQLLRLRAFDSASGLAFTALSYAFLLLPAAAAYGLCFPWTTARHCLPAVAVCAGLGFGFVATGIAATVWHLPLVTPALRLSEWLLRFIDPVAVSAGSADALLTFRGFTVWIGPQCAALDGVMLFLLLAGALWWQRSRRQPVRAMAGMAIGALALFFLNGVRLAAIMVIGTVSPELAVDLFHGLIGIVMLIAFLWAFDRYALVRNRA